MNINNFLLVFIILFIIGIIFFVINISNQKIEAFTDTIISGVPFPDIENDNDVLILSQNQSNIVNSSLITLNIRESLELKNNFKESFIITSSYQLDNTNDSISSLFKKNPPAYGVKLNSVNYYKEDGRENINNGFGYPVNFYNYISINFPNTNMTAYTIELSYSKYELTNVINNKPATDISIYTSENNVYDNLGTKTITENKQTTLIFIIPENKVIKSYLYIFISPIIKNITLTNIKFYVQKKEYMQKPLAEKDIIAFSTSNPAEQISIPLLYAAEEQIETDIGIGISISNHKKLNNLLKFIPPWAIYNGKNFDLNSKRIPELLGRNCKDAIISGKLPELKTENNISYLSGTIETKIEFPDFSLPEYYTICVISKYTSTNRADISRRGRILSCVSSENTNWLLGHWWNQVGVMHNYGWRTSWNESIPGDGNQWVVSCVKSASSVDKSLLFNGISRGIAAPPKMNNNKADNKLHINNNNIYVESSDFGLSYLIIWDVVLTDNQLRLVSDTLQEYLNTGIDLDLSDIRISQNDGSTKEKAAKSALDIKRLTCTNINGIYWILSENELIANPVYCIMDSTVYGGGWMLALKGAKNSGKFIYNSEHWTTNTILNDKEDNTNIEKFTDAKYNIYNNYKAVDCLAIFDSNDTLGELTFNNKPEYGWVWYQPNFFNGRISLLEFFKPRPGFPRGYSTYAYTSSNRGNVEWVKNWMRDRGFSGYYITPEYFEEYFVKVTCSQKGALNRRIFSHQEEFKSWGLNIYPQGWNHAVRWGGSFNENPGLWDGLPGSNDVSCGIGLEARNFSAGDAINCCQSSTGTNASMGFKWFIR